MSSGDWSVSNNTSNGDDFQWLHNYETSTLILQKMYLVYHTNGIIYQLPIYYCGTFWHVAHSFVSGISLCFMFGMLPTVLTYVCVSCLACCPQF